jgi:hypothetical protein
MIGIDAYIVRRVARDHRTIYFSSDRGVHVEFPRTHAQAVADLQRLDLWDNRNSNVWSLPIATWVS